MEAALSRGAVNHSVCLDCDHQQWLQGVADRAACAVITLELSTLWSDRLAFTSRSFSPMSWNAAEEEDPYEPDSLEGLQACGFLRLCGSHHGWQGQRREESLAFSSHLMIVCGPIVR